MHRLVFFLALVGTTAASAQPSYGVVEDRQSNVSSYFYHVLPGEATIGVYVWGTVRTPGLYEVGQQTDLGEVLSLAGGPLLAEERDDEEVETTVRLFRFEGDRRQLAYEAAVEDVLRAGTYPPLRDGDIVEVETAVTELHPFTWRDVITIVTGVAAVALSVDRPRRRRRRGEARRSPGRRRPHGRRRTRRLRESASGAA